jgi:hydroxyethylthiazole kinase-like uncharacterized protein yjeF
MHGAWPVAQIRAAEDAAMAVLPDGVLMQRAAIGLATECLRALGGAYGRRVLLLVGAGNNGGDALYAGAALARRGAAVSAVALDTARVHAGGRAALLAAGGRLVDRSDPRLTDVDLVVDGLLGIGGHGGLRPPAADLVAAVSGAAPVVAVDVPSGVDADTGAVDGPAVRADITVTFGALKPGLLAGPGAELVGELRLVDIGLASYLPGTAVLVLDETDVASDLRPPTAADDKYTRGVVGVIAGSATYSGAAVLSTGAALTGGSGMVRYVGGAADAVRRAWPEVVVHPDLATAGRVQAWAVGPGLGTDADARALVEGALAADVPVLLDADATTVVADHLDWIRTRSAPTVLTPHDREFARMFGAVGPDRIGAARRAAADVGATVLLKGNATVVAAPGGDVYVNRTGTPWLATAGSGDVLSGLIGSLLAAGHEPPRAAALGAFVHGLAGQWAGQAGPPSAGDVLAAIRPALHAIDAHI